MTSFDDKFRDKLDSHGYNKEPSDDQVSDFFRKFDGEDIVKSSFKLYLKLAASVILVLGVAWVSWSIANVEITTGLAEVKEIELPDHSTVTINAESKLSFNRIGWVLGRNVNLEGEAFFEIKKGENFAVVSAMGTTEVLGTSFNILARGDTYEVSCHTGKVRVTGWDSESVLRPGRRVKLSRNPTVKKSEFDTLKQTWKQGEYHYDNISLSEVIEDLERAFDLSINTSMVSIDKKYTGYFPSANQSLALQLVFEPFGYTFQVEKDEVILSVKID